MMEHIQPLVGRTGPYVAKILQVIRSMANVGPFALESDQTRRPDLAGSGMMARPINPLTARLIAEYHSRMGGSFRAALAAVRAHQHTSPADPAAMAAQFGATSEAAA